MEDGPDKQKRVEEPGDEGIHPERRVEPREERRVYLGCLGREALQMLSAAAGLLLLLAVVAVPAVLLASTSGSSDLLPSFPTGGDMLDYLVQTGDISQADGILATWYHRANNKSQMNQALASEVMVLEADVTLGGFGTPGQEPLPIMAHPPDTHSDNTLDQWLDAVLRSRKGIKLDFKSLAAVAPSLALLSGRNRSGGVNRPVWINADVLTGPNVPAYFPVVNGTRFLQLIQEGFPDVTVSPGWKVGYAPPLFTESYDRPMVENMYDLIRDVPQKVTFPVHALLVRDGWQHISWLLSKSPRFSLTLWQGGKHPNVTDLLFVRDNSHPARVYYDIYEPTLSAFKQAARTPGRQRQFYPGGGLVEYFYPPHGTEAGFLSSDADGGSLDVRWFAVPDRASLVARLSEGGGGRGMLVVRVGSSPDQPGVPLVEGSGNATEPLALEDVLGLVQSARGTWGLYLQVQGADLLEGSLRLLSSAYAREQLYRPVWVAMEISPRGSNTQGLASAQDFASAVDRLFPHVTLVLRDGGAPPRTPPCLRGAAQRVAVHLRAELLPGGGEELDGLLARVDGCDLVVEGAKGRGSAGGGDDDDEAASALKALVARREGSGDTRLYQII